MSDEYPLLFEPVYQDYVWGGGRIPELFCRQPRPGLTSAESWEISDRQEGMSVVSNGPFRGRTLRDIALAMGAKLLGRNANPAAPFPLLMKIIDAKERLSVQVHPDERSAAAVGGEPKTEMWYILGASPNAKVFGGLAPGADRNAFEKALRDKQVEKLLGVVPVKKGDAVYVPGGRIHSIGEGCLILEVQQNSNTTYRVYDWDRVGADGKPRELHVEQALRVINWNDSLVAPMPPKPAVETGRNLRAEVLACPFFLVERLDLRETAELANDGASFHALFVISGIVAVEAGNAAETIGAGASCLLPAALKRCALTPIRGRAALLDISLGRR